MSVEGAHLKIYVHFDGAEKAAGSVVADTLDTLRDEIKKKFSQAAAANADQLIVQIKDADNKPHPLDNEAKLKLDGAVPCVGGEYDVYVELPKVKAAAEAPPLWGDLPRFQPFTVNEDFPDTGPGRILFHRKEIVAGLVEQALNPKRILKSWINSHYIRGPAGSGKTVLLELIGRELLKYPEITVYHIKTATILDEYKFPIWEALVESARRSTARTVVLIDEVEKNFKATAWNWLLRYTRDVPNFVVIGFGINEVAEPYALLFQDKWETEGIFLTDGDLGEFVDKFAEMYHKPKHVVQEIAEVVLKFTGGHFYPFVSILDDFISSNEEWDEASAWKYLYSEKYFKSERQKVIVGRCFSVFDNLSLVSLVRNLLLGRKGNSHILQDLGLWNAGTRTFYSFLLRQHLFQLCCQEREASEEVLLEANRNWLSQTAVVVAAGLEGLDPACFDTPNESASEDGLGIAWAMQAQEQIPNLFLGLLGPRIGRKPLTVDILLNGRLNTALQLIRNGTAAQIDERFRRFDGAYKQWENHAVLNFQMRGKGVRHTKNGEKADRLFTFVREENTLYWGAEQYRRNVVRRLRSPPVSRFHTFLRRVWR